MPINPYTKGGNDVTILDGGTGASDAAGAISNLGALSTADHSTTDHSGIPGVGDLTAASHSALDHTNIPGVKTSFALTDSRNVSPSTSFTFTPGSSFNAVIPIDCTLTKIALKTISYFSAPTSISLQMYKNGSSFGSPITFSAPDGSVETTGLSYAALDDIYGFLTINTSANANISITLYFESA